MKRKILSPGFSMVEALLIVLFVAALALGGWYVYHHGHKTKPGSIPKRATASSAPVKPIAWQTYKNGEAGFTFRYPENWKSEVTNTSHYDNGGFAGVSGILTAPSGSLLEWVYQVEGGKGGDCIPNAGDTAFADGNNCASRQILDVQKIPSVAPPKTPGVRGLFEDSLYIIHTKYRAEGANSPTTYQICLDPYFNDDQQPETGTAVMGLLFPCQYWDTGFNVKFQVKDEAAFNSGEAHTAEQIMRSFDSL